MAKDPEYALAYARLADAYFASGEYAGSERKALREKSMAAVEKALSLDPDLSEAYEVSVSPKLMVNWDWAGAEESIKRAIELNPNNPLAHATYAWMLAAQGRDAEALRRC